jgi:hypothetical protein
VRLDGGDCLQRPSVRKQPITIRLQTVEKTNRVLDEKGISVRDSWAMPPEELAEILAVDAVVETRVEKTRYLSDLASYGIDVGRQILDEATEDKYGGLIPPGVPTSKTHDIRAEASLYNGDDGELLWKVAVHREADWQSPADDVVAGVTRKLAKEFPYRS